MCVRYILMFKSVLYHTIHYHTPPSHTTITRYQWPFYPSTHTLTHTLTQIHTPHTHTQAMYTEAKLDVIADIQTDGPKETQEEAVAAFFEKHSTLSFLK